MPKGLGVKHKIRATFVESPGSEIPFWFHILSLKSSKKKEVFYKRKM